MLAVPPIAPRPQARQSRRHVAHASGPSAAHTAAGSPPRRVATAWSRRRPRDASVVVAVATQRCKVRRVRGKRARHHASIRAQRQWRHTRHPQTAHRLGRLTLRCGCRSHGKALYVRWHCAHQYRCTTTSCAPVRSQTVRTYRPLRASGLRSCGQYTRAQVAGLRQAHGHTTIAMLSGTDPWICDQQIVHGSVLCHPSSTKNPGGAEAPGPYTGTH